MSQKTQAIILQSNTIRTLWQARETLKPFAQEIFVLKTHIAGTYFSKAERFIPRETEFPLKVILQREPKNEFDDLAILVLTEKGEKLGYIPQVKNEIIARLMDAGKKFSAHISRASFNSDWLKLEIEVFLVDY